MLQNPCLKRLLLCSKCTVYLKYLHKYYMVEVIFFPTLKYTVFCKDFPLNDIFTLFFLYIFFLWKNTLFLSFYIFSYIKIHCFLLGFFPLMLYLHWFSSIFVSSEKIHGFWTHVPFHSKCQILMQCHWHHSKHQ